MEKLTELEFNYLNIMDKKGREYLISIEQALFLKQLLHKFKISFFEGNNDYLLLSHFFKLFNNLVFYENRTAIFSKKEYKINIKETLIEISQHDNFCLLLESLVKSSEPFLFENFFLSYLKYQNIEKKKRFYKICIRNKDFTSPDTILKITNMLKQYNDFDLIYPLLKNKIDPFVLESIVKDKIEHLFTLNNYDEASLKNIINIFKEVESNSIIISTSNIYKLLAFYIFKGDSKEFKELIRIIDTDNIKRRLIRGKRLQKVKGVDVISFSKGLNFEIAIFELFDLKIPVDISKPFISFHDLTVESQLFMLSVEKNEGKINKILKNEIDNSSYVLKKGYVELNNFFMEHIILNYKI